MAITRISSLVFVGGQFPLEMFEERDLFDGKLDRGGQVKIGPIGQFSYLSGTYRFEITPPRIDLKYNGESILPVPLVNSAKVVAGIIQQARGAVPVSGFGMNCDTVFDRVSTGVSGVEFCSRLVNRRLAELARGPSTEAMVKVRFSNDAMRYEVRFEPQAESRGENLLVAVNGHQAISSSEDLQHKLQIGRLQAFRDYVKALEHRILEVGG